MCDYFDETIIPIATVVDAVRRAAGELMQLKLFLYLEYY